MMTDTILTGALLAAALTTALVTGLLFGFALITMPGIRRLGDREFVRAFQVMDAIIQRNNPLFLLVWAGSALLLLFSAIIGLAALPPAAGTLLVGATVVYFLGVQLPTVAVNVPLNNALQRVNAASDGDRVVREARIAFEARWNRWNRRRTLLATVVTATLLVVLLLR